ncbi:hypothetical protein RhiirA1_480375 [Rhizophagus irregularis]|uniref:DUF8211 domain-containing protein n=1 Tax=Rhizophagus irregularis TaxID=588596 RepID=A0A2N0QPE6_9GLOM|nr:hypothetical protein RhiirA1_480375 [Rhizophagus irregularis]
MRKTFHNAKLISDALMDDKLQAARHHKFLFQENQQFSTPIKHLRYKKKFVVPKQDDYTFPLPFPETNTNLMVPASGLNHTDSSVIRPLIGNSTPPSSVVDIFENVPAHYILLIPERPLYEGGLYNQPSSSKIKKRKLKPLTDMLYERKKTDAGIRWDTTPKKGIYRQELCNVIMEYTDARHDYELKLLEVSSTIQTVPGSLKKSEQKKREKDIAKKEQEDTQILEELLNRVITLDHAIYSEYHREEVGLKYLPCALMEKRLLKRRACDNGNLDTFYGFHKTKKFLFVHAY